MSALADVERGWSVPYNACPVMFTRHAIDQANRRHFRLMDADRAERELYRLAAERGVVTSDPPTWLHKRHRGRARCWLVISRPAMAFPLYRDSTDGAAPAGTCLTPGQTPVGASIRWTGAAAGLDETSGHGPSAPREPAGAQLRAAASRHNPPRKGS
jgi:hypothetical protein